jgi:nucleotide-binding universal stress UspA family protein
MTRLQRLLAATDLSTPARHAAERAASVARATGAELELVHVGAFSRAHELRRLVSQLPLNLPDRMREQAQMLLDALVSTLRKRHGVAARTHVATGPLLKAIEDTAGTIGADLLVLGARGASMLRHRVLGSTAERLVSHCSRPLLVVKRAPATDYRRVLVPVDFSVSSLPALQLAHAVAPDAVLVLMHAYEAPFEGRLIVAGVEEEHLREYRERARRGAGADAGALRAGGTAAREGRAGARAWTGRARHPRAGRRARLRSGHARSTGAEPRRRPAAGERQPQGAGGSGGRRARVALSTGRQAPSPSVLMVAPDSDMTQRRPKATS